MNPEPILLRIKPKLEFILSEKYFQIINNRNKSDNGTYFYEWTEFINFQRKKTNWFVTILSYVVEFILAFVIGGSGDGGNKYKTKEKLIIAYKDKSIEIDLEDCDLNRTEYFTQELKLRLN